MDSRTASLVIGALLVLAPDASAREDVRFRRLSIEDGLSQSTVEAIAQDHEGFMWFGTEDGLNRYDGYAFTKHKHDPDLPGSISGNNIWCLLVDRDGLLWIGTFSSGLNRYDPGTGTFTRFVHDPSDTTSISSDRIRCLAQDARGDVWVGTRDAGLNRLRSGTTRFERMRHDPRAPDGLPSDNVRFVLPDTGSVYWIATDRGFSRFDARRNAFTHFRAGRAGPGSLGSDNVRHLCRDRAGTIWVSTARGLAEYDPATGRLANHRHDPTDPASLGADSVRRTYEDRQGRLWVSTTKGGLNLLDRETSTFTRFRHDRHDPHSLSNDSVRVTYQDEGGVLWVGTIGGGLSVHDPRTGRFRHYGYDPDDATGLRGGIVWAIAEGPGGDLWFGTSRGVERHDRRTGKVALLALDAAGRGGPARGRTARCLTWDEDGLLWIGRLDSGIDIHDPASGVTTNLRRRDGEDRSLGADNVRAIYRDDRGDMWFGTWGGGLDNYDRQTGSFRHFRHDPDDPASLGSDNVVSVLQDSDGAYWVATDLGLNRIVLGGDPERPVSAGGRPARIARFRHDPDDPRSISNDYVLSIHEAGDGDLWFGTMLGLSRLRKRDRARPVFERYFMKDGLPSDVVYGILEDDGGRLWLSTNSGLSRLDPGTGTFRNYDTRDGLLGDEYNTGAYARTSAGAFLFGGVGGASGFDPDRVVDSAYRPPVVLTGFDVLDRPARLDRSLAVTGEVVLSHRENTFSFEFAALDFAMPDRNRYSYMLEGLDRTWSPAGTRRYAGYTRVDAGTYTFMVRGTNADGVWSDDIASLRIVVTPPFWQTWWFTLLVVAAIGGGVAALVVARVRQLLAIERLRSRIAADLHDDIGAGLTEIALMGNVITQKLPPDAGRLVLAETERIRATARSLIAGMSDIVWLVDPGRDSLHDLVARLSDSFRETLHARDVRLTTENLDSLRKVRLGMEQRQHLLLIFKEAINNSVKHAACSEIRLEVELEGGRLAMRVRDDGKGFDAPADPAGNGLRNMRDRARRLGGTVAVRSVAGEGTTVEYRGAIG